MSTTAVFVLSLLLAAVCATRQSFHESDCVKHNRTSNAPPQTSEFIHTKLQLFTRKNSQRGWDIEPTYSYSLRLSDANFVDNRQTVFVVHGFQESGTQASMIELKDALLYRLDANVFLVDWSKGAQLFASTYFYDQAASNTRVVGEVLAAFAKELISDYKARPEAMYGIGFGLGSQVLAHFGQNLPDLGRITALDPASPCFEGLDPQERLGVNDARHVDIVHTTFRRYIFPLSTLTLGYKNPAGDVDIFLHSTSLWGEQPGCGGIKPEAVGASERYFLDFGACSHQYAYKVFTASLRLQDNVWACKEGYRPAEGQVHPEGCVQFGVKAFNSPETGTFYLSSTAEYPYLMTKPNSE